MVRLVFKINFNNILFFTIRNRLGDEASYKSIYIKPQTSVFLMQIGTKTFSIKEEKHREG